MPGLEAAGGKALVLPTDVADAEQISAAAAAVDEAFGPIGIWINNPMISVLSRVKATTLAEVRHQGGDQPSRFHVPEKLAQSHSDGHGSQCGAHLGTEGPLLGEQWPFQRPIGTLFHQRWQYRCTVLSSPNGVCSWFREGCPSPRFRSRYGASPSHAV